MKKFWAWLCSLFKKLEKKKPDVRLKQVADKIHYLRTRPKPMLKRRAKVGLTPGAFGKQSYEILGPERPRGRVKK